MLVIVNIKPTSIETSVNMMLQLNIRVKKKQITELLLLKADCRRLGLGLSVSSSSLGSTSIRRCFCNTHPCGNVSVDCSSSCGSSSGSISNKTQLFDVCVEMYCFH